MLLYAHNSSNYLCQQVLVKSTHLISRSSGLKTLARSVGRKNHRSIAHQVLKNPKCRANVLSMLSADIQIKYHQKMEKNMLYNCPV